jgi:hypothetical protein
VRALPHLSELVQLHKDDPFALVGIATDQNLQDFATRAKAAGVNWRNAWAGGTGGAWPTAWGVQRYPTVYVLDGQGVVRFVDVRGEALSTAVRTLIAEQRAARPSPTK